MTNKQHLQALIKQHGIDRYAVADMVHCRKSTVDTWLANETAANFRRMPDNLLELLRLKLK